VPAGRSWARIARSAVFGLGLLPAAWLAYGLWLEISTGRGFLGANPVEFLEHHTGDWALRFLLLTLAVTPIRRLTGWNGLQKYRRMLGLFAFFYATLHLGIYAALDLELMFGEIGEDIAERFYITIGMASWLFLVPLAITSTRGWIRRLGGKRWNRLHRLTYVCAVGGVLHYFLSVKRDVREPLVYVAIAAALLGWRLWKAAEERRRVAA
jgi:sulfoxide reductase heme-binding subunit YedZ